MTHSQLMGDVRLAVAGLRTRRLRALSLWDGGMSILDVAQLTRSTEDMIRNWILYRRLRDRPRESNRGGVVKLTPSDCYTIRCRYRDGGVLQRELGEEYGVEQSYISKIVRGISRPR